MPWTQWKDQVLKRCWKRSGQRKLRSVKKEMGQLRSFWDYAAGTGKTYAMLEAARELKKQQVDVIAGYVEPHARPETAALLEGLEQLPFLMVDYKGVKIREFDLDAALKRPSQSDSGG